MAYSTMRSRTQAEIRRRTSGVCPCGKRLNKRNIKHYRNRYGEYVPICRECAEVVKDYLEVI